MNNPIDGTASARQYLSSMEPGSDRTAPGAANQEAGGDALGAAPIQAPNEQAVRDGASVAPEADPTRTTTETQQTEPGENRLEDRRLGSRFDAHA